MFVANRPSLMEIRFLPAESSPDEVIERQLRAYNARQLDEWLDTYDADAEQHELHGGLLARGRAAIRLRMEKRFSEPVLHATLLSRVVAGHFVVDVETIVRSGEHGIENIRMLCIYEVVAGKIVKASFAQSPL
jgi:hypothetical protein